jgi:DNA-binding NarL/FixJ family response regulator
MLVKMKETSGVLLTMRERLILRFVRKGCTNKEIAETLFVSIETIKKHLQNIYRKLDVGNKIEALQKAGML